VKKTVPKKPKKMPPKKPKMTDVTKPGTTVPSPTSRPIVVANRSVMANDPMIAQPDVPATPADAPAVHRSQKVVAPVSPDLQMPATDTDASEPVPAAEPEAVPADAPTTAAGTGTLFEKPAPAETNAPAQPDTAVGGKGPSASGATEPGPKPAARPNPEASAADQDDVPTDATPDEITAQAAAAEEARRKELEQLIEAGAYAVPINAVQRKRSQAFVVAMIILSIILALALLDAALDSGMLKLSFNVPHTHFLTAK
jgi:hypothetical protein